MPVLDASVFVSLCHARDRHHQKSKAWLRERLLQGERLAAPTLLRVEVAAAIRRLTGDAGLALAAVSEIDDCGWLDLVELTSERSRRAAEIAAATGVRGADAVYLELASHRGHVLVTWDRQQLTRGRDAAHVATP